MLAEIARRIARVFARSGNRVLFPEDLSALQNHLSQTCGGLVMLCGCGGYVTPVVDVYPSQRTVEALACVVCHQVTPLKKRGVIDRNTVIANRNEAEGETLPPPAGATVH
jgi:hypothetical protein